MNLCSISFTWPEDVRGLLRMSQGSWHLSLAALTVNVASNIGAPQWSSYCSIPIKQKLNKASEPWQHVPFKSDTKVARIYNCLQSLKPMALHWIRIKLIRHGKQHQIWTTKCQLKSYSLLKPSLSTCTNQIKPTCSVVGSGRFLWPVSSEHQKTRWPGCPDVPVV